MRARVALITAFAIAAILTGCGKHSGKDKHDSPNGEEAKPNAELFLTPPGPSTIYRGKTLLVQVRLDRKNASGPVRITFDRLPTGVSVLEADQGKKFDGEVADLTLQAVPKAELVQEHEVVVNAEGPHGTKSSGRFRLNVMK